MKSKYLTIVILISFQCFYSCKKDVNLVLGNLSSYPDSTPLTGYQILLIEKKSSLTNVVPLQMPTYKYEILNEVFTDIHGNFLLEFKTPQHTNYEYLIQATTVRIQNGTIIKDTLPYKRAEVSAELNYTGEKIKIFLVPSAKISLKCIKINSLNDSLSVKIYHERLKNTDAFLETNHSEISNFRTFDIWVGNHIIEKYIFSNNVLTSFTSESFTTEHGELKEFILQW